MLIEYYVCDCGYEVTRDDVDTEGVKLSSHMVGIIDEGICFECGSWQRNNIQVKRFICPTCEKDLALLNRSVGSDDEGCADYATGTLQVMGTPYKVPIHSDAFGLMPDQVAEHRKKFPDIDIDDQNRPVFTNTRQHQDYLNKVGARKQTQKTGQSRGKIYSYPGSKCS